MNKLLRKCGVCILTAGLLAGSAPAQARTLSLTPSGPWQVDFGDQGCVALRPFKDGRHSVVLGLEPNPDKSGMRVVFQMPERRVASYSIGFMPADFSIDGRQLSDRVTLWPGQTGGLLLITGTRDEAGDPPLALAEAKSARIRTASLNAEMRLPGMRGVTALLDRCNRGLLKAWGFSEADQDRLASWPRLTQPARQLFTPADYPRSALRAGAQGEVRVRVQVAADGTASACTVRHGSGFGDLDRATCEVIGRRARFIPAHEKSGQAMAAPAFITVRWLIGRR